MSSPYPPSVHRHQHADENPASLTIRRVEDADANGSRSIFGENVGRLSFGSERSKFGNVNTVSVGFAKSDLGANAEKSGFLKVESSTFRASTEKSRIGERDNSGLCSSGEKTGLRGAEGVELEANREESKGFGAGGYGSGVGGKLRSLRRGNKRTPYDRPLTGRHATAGGSAAMQATALPSSELTVASRLRDSASRFIQSSASYVFSALFKRGPPSVKANGESKYTGVGIPVEEEICEERLETPAKQNNPTSGPASQVPPLVDAGVKPTGTEGRVLDIVQVEDILKQKTWSREQVNRLTQILQTRVSEIDDANPIVEEAEKTEEQPKPEAKDSSPVQVARAYMGEQATRPSGIAATVRKSAFFCTEVQPSPVRKLVEDRYLSSPFSRNWARSSAAVRMPKRSLAREDDLASMGPVRRVRQKTSMLTNASPYSWRMTGLSKPLEMQTSSPPSQSSQTALKILETLEKLSPSPPGKFLEVSPEKSASGIRVLEKFSPTPKGKTPNEAVDVAGISTSEQIPESSKAREKILVQNLGLVSSPKATESKLIGKMTFGGMNYNNSDPVKKSVIEVPSSISESQNITPVLGKGFRMNAVFEESNSDEEAKLQAKLHASTEARDTAAPNSLKEEATATPDSAVTSIAADLSGSFLPQPVQALSSSVLMLKSRSLPATPSLSDKPEPFAHAVSQGCLVTFPPLAMETRSTLPREATSSPAGAAEVKLPVEEVLRVPNSAGAKPASPSIFARQTESSQMITASTTTMAFLSNSSEFAITAVPVSASVGTTAPASLGNASTDSISVFLSPVPVTSKTVVTRTDVPEAGNAVTMATESPFPDKLAEVDTMATDSMAEEADTSASPMPFFLSNANAQPSTASMFSFSGDVSSSSSSAVTFSFGGGLGTASTGASASSSSAPSFVFGGQSSTVSAGQAPNSSIGVPASFPSATSFTFGGQSSNVPGGQVPTFAMGTSASSSSTVSSFAFGGQLGTIPVGQTPNFVAKSSVLFDQSGAGSTGQALSFGALPSSPANPFSSTAGNSSSPFMFGSSTAAAFGSSAVSSTSSVFTSSSSGVPSFGASSTFQFGPPALPSPLASAPSMSSMTTSSFTTSSFSSSPAPTLSATPTFPFGSSAALSSSAGSSSSGQLFAFGAAQSNPFATNPFSSSGTQTPASAFNFGAPAMAATPFPFSSSGSPASMFASNAAPNPSNVFAFGSNATPNPSSPFAFASGQPAPAPAQAPTPAPFAFGGQPAAVPPANGQLFGFGGGQPAAPAANPFSAAVTNQPGAEFAGGFALGATSGDKSSRKYIKAKRITKRGK